LVRAVSSGDVSVGRSIEAAILRKSFTACEALAALPPTPRMKSGRRGANADEFPDAFLAVLRVDLGDDLGGFLQVWME